MSRQGWTHFQDTLLLQAYEKYADKWQFISTAFPCKTAIECAARYKVLSERGEATISEYQFRNKANTGYKCVKKEFTPKLSPFAPSNSVPRLKTTVKAETTPVQSKPCMANYVKTEPIESFLDFFSATQSIERNATTSPLHPGSDLMNGPDEEIEKRHEFSSIKIPRWEVDDLFQETVEMMQEEEKGIFPDLSTEEPNWAMTKKQKFSIEQLNMIQNQLNGFLQLTVQTYSISKETNGLDDRKTLEWKKELEDLIHLKEWGRSVIGDNSLFNIKGAQLIPKIYSIPVNKELHDSVDFKYNLKIAVQPKVKSRFLESKDSPNNSTKKRAKQLKTVPLTESIKNTLDIFTGIFDPKLRPEIIPVVESDIYDFSTFEIDLLFVGLQTFGFSDFASVRAFNLPTKTVTQIRRKFQNVKYRKASKGMEKIKTLWLQPFKPLVVTERELLVEGYKKFGKRFRVTVRTLFGTYPTTLLKQVWDELHLLGEIDATWLNPRCIDSTNQNKPVTVSKPTRRSPRKPVNINTTPMALPPLMIRAHRATKMSPHSTPLLHGQYIKSFDIVGQKENYRNLYPTSVFHHHQSESHSFLQELFTDTGSLYNPTSEWDPYYTNNVAMTDQIEDINYDDFLETIFEPDIAQNEARETAFCVSEAIDQNDGRPLISFSGAYDYDSSDEERQSTVKTPVKPFVNTEDQEIESFFETNQSTCDFLSTESIPFISPDRRVTRASSRIVTANNSASKDKLSPKQQLNKTQGKRGARKSLLLEFANEKTSNSKKRTFNNSNIHDSESLTKKLCADFFF